ncbi:MAG TPA: selenium metabolism-associated LysR family transcriptional regulator [Methylomirabilota bacterium]|nr:selenium metabolism-associated LysR family transcriptional regulator [Methylomirabilota bacterium]
MTIRQLEVFLAIAHAQSFSRAAERIHLSQPTLSEHMKELEEELGVSLFIRHSRSVSLTEPGRVFEDYATRVVATLAAGRHAIAELDGRKRGSLVVGASTTPGTYVLPARIAKFREQYPGITVALRIANSRAVQERVRDGEVDLAVIGGHVLGPSERCVAAGILDELELIVPPDHPVKAASLTPAKLGRERLLIREEGSATRQATERALREAGVTLRPAMELDHTETIKRAVMAGLGVAFVSRYAVEDEVRSGRLRVLAVQRMKIRRHFHVIYDERRPLSASARAFTAFLEASDQTPRPSRRT